MNAIIPRAGAITLALVAAVEMWADAKTDATSKRRDDLLRDKIHALLGDDHENAVGFFIYTQKPIETITPGDIKRWQSYLEENGLSASSIYARVSRVSSFYAWLMRDPAFAARIPINPVQFARPNAPKAYQSERSLALTDDDARALLLAAREDASKGKINAKRDYALLRFYFATGKRRDEVIRLRWGDLKFTDDAIIIQSREKGGLYRATEIRDPGVRGALLEYLRASERWDVEKNTPALKPNDPLWLRHDRAAKGQQPVTSHGFVLAFKKYAKRAGIGDVHLHQTRHTVARMVGEQSGDLAEVQTVLGHQNLATTRIYLERVSVKRDKHSRKIAGRLGLDEEE